MFKSGKTGNDYLGTIYLHKIIGSAHSLLFRQLHSYPVFAFHGRYYAKML